MNKSKYWFAGMKRTLRGWMKHVDPRFLPSPWLLRFDSVHDCRKLVKAIEVKPSEKVETPEIMGMQLIPAAAHVKKPYHIVPPVEAFLVKNAYFFAYEEQSHNLLLCERRRVIKEFCNSLDEARSFPWAPLCFARAGEAIEGRWTSLRSVSNNHGHTLLDNLPRLAALTLENLGEAKGVNLLVAGSLTSFEKYALERLFPNLAIKHLQRRRLYKVEEYLLLSNPRQKRFGGYLPSWYLEYFRTRMLPSRESRRDKRIYISRERAGMRRVVNEHEVVSLLKTHGFEKYNLEELTPQEEVDLFYDAEAVVGPAGSGMFNIIFSKNIKVLDIYPTTFARPETYFLSKSLGHEYSCAYSPHQDFSVDFYCDVQAIKVWLRDAGL